MPDGGGEVLFTCPVRRSVKPLNFIDLGKIKRIRGTAYLFPRLDIGMVEFVQIKLACLLRLEIIMKSI